MRPIPAGLDGRIAMPWIASSRSPREARLYLAPHARSAGYRITSAPGATAQRGSPGSSPSRWALSSAAPSRPANAQHVRIGVVDLIQPLGRARRDHFVAGDEYPDARLPDHRDLRLPERRDKSCVLRTKAATGNEHGCPCGDVLAESCHVLARSDGSRDFDAARRFGRVLRGNDGVDSFGHRSPGHDPDGVPRRDAAAETLPG
jgi:hypothetical protein